MNIIIGSKIKELRKKHNLTQEKLAEYLGISFQAISKWENSITLPDITFIPTIASFFGVSIDELFDFNLKETNDKVKLICDEAFKYRETDSVKAQTTLQEGLKQFPNNEIILNNLLYVLDYNKNPDDTIKIAERLISETIHDDIKYDALRFLAYAYHKKGEYEYAKATLEQIPELYFTRLSELAFILEGKDKYNAAEKQKWISYEILLQMMQKLFEYYISNGETDKAISELNTAIKLLDVFNHQNFANYRTFFNKELDRISATNCK